MAMGEKESWRCGWCWRLCKHTFNMCPHCGGEWKDRDLSYAPQMRSTSPRVRHPAQQWDSGQSHWDEEGEWNQWDSHWNSQPNQRPKSPRRSQKGPKGQKGQKGHGKGKTKGKQKSQLSQAEEELQFGPTALGVKLPAPPWTPPVSGATSSAGNATNTATPMDSQLRGFLNEMKKVVDLPADGHAIIQKYQKKQRTVTTKTMHQSVTDVSQAREALDKAHLARHQLHTSWRNFLSEALETFQAYTEGFKQQEAALVAGIEDAKQQFIAAKEVFEECRSALTDLSSSDQQLIAGAEAAMTSDETMEDPAVARLQSDLDSMQGHLKALRSSADTMLTETPAPAKRQKLAVEVETGDGSAVPGPMEPFGAARK